MKKPWSITTTLRSPDRLRDFLLTLRELENSEWDYENQKKYQILLIQNRLYGYGSPQFYKNIPRDKVELIDDLSKKISFEQATEIFNMKNYEDPAMRGRQSINPLKKMGAVTLKDGLLKITDFGKLFFKDDFDLGEVFFKSFLKWQKPEHRTDTRNRNYDIKPFVGTLHLIDATNKKEIARGNKPKGLSKKEFSLFVPTLTHYQNINAYAEKIIILRDKLRRKTKQEGKEIFTAYEKQFIGEFLGTKSKNKIAKLLSNLRDYGDNTIRYFRLTRYIYIRGGGFYVDLDPRRSIELDSLLTHDNAQVELFESKKEYLAYVSDISKPELPWETQEKYILIVEKLAEEIKEYEKKLKKEHVEIKNIQEMSQDDLKNYISELRIYRRLLQEEEDSKASQMTENIKSYISVFENIFEHENRPILLEKFSALGLHALNDALRIKPNYPVGDDNEPTFTAPANTPDIECYYESFNAICEVTVLIDRRQWYHEGQPVMRHLRDFEEKHKNKPSYCLFIAPKLHRDTINTFWSAIRYEYEGQKQKIIPLSISHFVLILDALVKMKTQNKFLKHTDILRLYDEILDTSDLFKKSGEWLASIPETIRSWQKNLVS